MVIVFVQFVIKNGKKIYLCRIWGGDDHNINIIGYGGFTVFREFCQISDKDIKCKDIMDFIEKFQLTDYQQQAKEIIYASLKKRYYWTHCGKCPDCSSDGVFFAVEEGTGKIFCSENGIPDTNDGIEKKNIIKNIIEYLNQKYLYK